MNQKVREGIKNIANTIGYCLNAAVRSFISILRMLVLSSPRVAWKSRKYKTLKQSDTCCVLGNGPSLKDALEKGEVRLNGSDVFVVNMFCQSDYFWDIKPRFYFLVDGALFAPKDERSDKLVDELIEKFNKVDWQMYLVISSSSAKGRLLESVNNHNVKVIKMNSTIVEGFRIFSHFIYRIRMGMPRCQTVVNFALTTGVDMGYSTILLYGADHTWTRDLFVNEDNVVCYGDRHVYNTGLTVIKHTRTMAEILMDFSRMFATHMAIRKYADSQHVQVLNATKGTFVDAYERVNY